MDWSPPGSFIHGMLQARFLEWVAISFSRRSSQTRDRTPGLLHWQEGSLPVVPPTKPGNPSRWVNLSICQRSCLLEAGKHSWGTTHVGWFPVLLPPLPNFRTPADHRRISHFVLKMYIKIVIKKPSHNRHPDLHLCPTSEKCVYIEISSCIPQDSPGKQNKRRQRDNRW